jgi:type III pantothenate kinase
MSATTILVVDVGNTRLKWGLAQAGRWLLQDAVDTADAEGFEHALARLPVTPSVAVGCNVAGPAVGARVYAAVVARGVDMRWNVSQASQAGVTNGYDEPSRLGADRWAALIGAWARVGSACVVVNAGTAITVDSLSRDGQFLGGIILPGLETMLHALEVRTAGLRRLPGSHRDFPTTTADAMTTGVVDAAVGAVQRVQGRLALLVRGEVRTLLSGGAAESLRPHLADGCECVDQLVLEGLRIVAEGRG